MKKAPKAILTTSSFLSMFFLGVGTAVIGGAADSIGLSIADIGLLQAVQNGGFLVSVVIFGYLADSRRKPLLLALGGVFLGTGFFLLFAFDSLILNALMMIAIGVGSGSYEGVTDVLLVELHENKKGFIININHLFVSAGSLGITLYLIFLDANWRPSMIEAGSVVVVFSILFFVYRNYDISQTRTSGKSKFLTTGNWHIFIILFLCLLCTMGIQIGSVGILPTFLLNFRGFSPDLSRVGLIIYLMGIVTGRLAIGAFIRDDTIEKTILIMFGLTVATSILVYFVNLRWLAFPLLFSMGLTLAVLLPSIVTLTGILFPRHAGAAMGAVKLGIPAGGLVIPSTLSFLARIAGDRLSMAVFPLTALSGFLLVLLSLKTIGKTRLLEKESRS